MNLGTWIEELSAHDRTLPIKFDDGTHPGKLRSWRGMYERLSLDTGHEHTNVGALLDDAVRAVGATFTGYKGGDYVMHVDTPVYADEWGRCPGMGIAGIDYDGAPTRLIIKRIDLSDYS